MAMSGAPPVPVPVPAPQIMPPQGSYVPREGNFLTGGTQNRAMWMAMKK